MTDSDSVPSEVTPETGWFRFGLVIAVLHLSFLALVLVLLRIDVGIALTVAVALSIVGGVAITLFALRWC